MHELDGRIERAVGSRPVRYTPRAGGYSAADRFTVELADGRRVFAAVVGTPPPDTAPRVRELQERQLAVTLDWIDRELRG